MLYKDIAYRAKFDTIDHMISLTALPSGHGPDRDPLKEPTLSYFWVHFGSKIFCISFSVLVLVHPKMGLVWYHKNQKRLKWITLQEWHTGLLWDRKYWKCGTESPDSNPLSASKMPAGYCIMSCYLQAHLGEMWMSWYWSSQTILQEGHIVWIHRSRNLNISQENKYISLFYRTEYNTSKVCAILWKDVWWPSVHDGC